MRINGSSAFILMARSRLLASPVPPPSSRKASTNLWRGYTLPGNTNRFTFPGMQEHLCKWNVPGQDFGSWAVPVAVDQPFRNCTTHCIPYPVSMLSWGPKASPHPVMHVHMPCVLARRSCGESHQQGQPSVLLHIYSMGSASAWRQDLKTFGPLYHCAVVNGLHKLLSYAELIMYSYQHGAWGGSTQISRNQYMVS